MPRAGAGHPVGAAVLDDAQRAVLELPLTATAAVLGAPGSGKTLTLVELIADRVLNHGLAPEQVLVLAPNRLAATRLRDRLAVRLGVPSAGPIARTANSVAFQVVRAASEQPVTLLTGGEQDSIMSELLLGDILDQAGPDWPHPLGEEVRQMRGFRTELRELSMRCAEHGVSMPRLAELGRAHDHPEWVAAAEFLDGYADNKEQARPGQYDSAELSTEAAVYVARAEPGAAGAATLGPLAGVRLIAVDDAQDATGSTIALLQAFAARGVAIVAFGDPDVASTAFRGARSEVLGRLGEALGVPGTARLVLSTVYRGRPELRELVGAVVGHIGTALAGLQRRAELAPSAFAGPATGETAVAADAGAPDAGASTPAAPSAAERIGYAATVRIEASSHAAECGELARLLREHHLLRGMPWARMAVVVRSGADIAGLERGLSLSDVPTRAATARRALRDDPAAAQLLAAASVAIGVRELTAPAAVEILTGPLGRLDAIALRRLRLSLRQQELAGDGTRTSDELLVEAMRVPGGFGTIDSGPAARAGRAAANVAEAARVAAAGGSIEEVLWQLWQGAGLGTEWGKQARGTGVLADEANRALDGAVALFAAAQRFVERTPELPPAQFIADVLASDLPEDSLAPQSEGDAVLICTPPGVVGQDFDVVVLAGLQEGVWPNLKPRGSLLHPELVEDLAGLGDEPAAAGVNDERAAVRSDELRMFALAASRAHRQLVLSCTSNDDEQPSTFMGFVPDLTPLHRGRPLHLRGLVGSLRRELVERGTPAAASALALLASEEIPGAHPASWYGMRPPSTLEPLVDLEAEGAVVAVSPSQIEKAEKSALAWFVDTVAASPGGLAASIGTIVHAVMETASTKPDADLSVDGLWAEAAERWKQLRFEAPWLAERERRGAERLLGGLSEYLGDFADDGKTLLQAEGRFTVDFEHVSLHGSVDRVERTADGTTVIVDLKTGSRMPTQSGMAEHPQLAAYQLGMASGAIPTGTGEGDEGTIGGAKLVFVSSGVRGKSYSERTQQPMDEAALEAFRQRLLTVSRAISGASFAGPLQLDFNDPLARWEYRIHLVPAVSA
ncbi:Superfamily I DNA or RNA helicase [Microterricola viridarii]|uniref:DNA 3'-5' helicase n=1 Tax=Microterricola viridarii TaxID=412690 RepID=A0A1H1RUS1_9MICO|nr:Superfamily I DNA or RNA helicase [Microterricola viridarii]